MSLSITRRWLRRPLLAASIVAASLLAVGSATQAQAQYYPYYAYNPYYSGYSGYCDPNYYPYGCPTTYNYPSYAYSYPYYGYAAPVALGLGFGFGHRFFHHGGFRGGGFHGGFHHRRF